MTKIQVFLETNKPFAPEDLKLILETLGYSITSINYKESKEDGRVQTSDRDNVGHCW